MQFIQKLFQLTIDLFFISTAYVFTIKMNLQEFFKTLRSFSRKVPTREFPEIFEFEEVILAFSQADNLILPRLP
jgi:hypothetical protein